MIKTKTQINYVQSGIMQNHVAAVEVETETGKVLRVGQPMKSKGLAKAALFGKLKKKARKNKRSTPTVAQKGAK
jgi:uncharacterized protein (AIM24 family)